MQGGEKLHTSGSRSAGKGGTKSGKGKKMPSQGKEFLQKWGKGGRLSGGNQCYILAKVRVHQEIGGEKKKIAGKEKKAAPKKPPFRGGKRSLEREGSIGKRKKKPSYKGRTLLGKKPLKMANPQKKRTLPLRAATHHTPSKPKTALQKKKKH